MKDKKLLEVSEDVINVLKNDKIYDKKDFDRFIKVLMISLEEYSRKGDKQ